MPTTTPTLTPRARGRCLGKERGWVAALWIASCALVLGGVGLLCGASQSGPLDLGTAATVTTDPSSGAILDCETANGSCSRELATDSVEYALSLPLLTSGLTGLLLGLTTCAWRAPGGVPPCKRSSGAPDEGAAQAPSGTTPRVPHGLFLPPAEPDVADHQDPGPSSPAGREHMTVTVRPR